MRPRYAVVLTTVAAALPGAATPQEPGVVPIVFATATNPAAEQYVCVAKADDPHWSKKERGGTVLLKTRVTCTGPGLAQVRVVGTLASSRQEGGPYKNLASSDKTQWVKNDGKTETTYYTPPQNAATVRGSAWYRATITATVVAPVTSNLAPATSRERWVDTP